MEFEDRVAGFIKASNLFESADKILLAVSGGPDSTALLHTMCALKAEGILGADLICAHINHRLRGAEAEADEDFVVAQAHKLNLPITTSEVDVRGFAREKKLSIETAARKLRIKSLVDIAKANNCDWIATGHQKDDNAETVLQRLARGTGFRGLGGIWPQRVFETGTVFVRPLLCVTRSEIVEHLNKRKLKWRIDKTNEYFTYRRNFIRHRLIPDLQRQYSGSLVEQLSRLSHLAQEFYRLVCSSAEKAWPEPAECSDGSLKLDLEIFLTQPEPVKVELIRRSLAAVGSGERDLTHGHYERILQLAAKNIGDRKVTLPSGFVVWREYGNLIFTRVETLKPREHIGKDVKLEMPGKTEFGNYLIESTFLEARECDVKKFKTEKDESVEWFDLDKLKLPLVVRFRKAGDRFWPLGLAVKKRIGKFLTAEKVPQEIRRKLLIIADSEKVIWLWPIRISEQAKIASRTRKVLQLQINEGKKA